MVSLVGVGPWIEPDISDPFGFIAVAQVALGCQTPLRCLLGAAWQVDTAPQRRTARVVAEVS
jgi:ABC-type uncharacterized transport system permease subunit